MPFGNLFFHKPDNPKSLFLKYMHCLDRLSSRRQLINLRHVQVTILRHRQGARDRSRRHHKRVRRKLCLIPERGSLRDAEAVLLVDDAET